MTRRHFSIAFWVVLFIALLSIDTFGVPEFMNRTHGSIRLLGLAAFILPMWPAAMVVMRVYQLLTTKAFIRKHDIF